MVKTGYMVSLQVTLFDSKRKNSKVILDMQKDCFLIPDTKNLKTRLSNDNLSEIVHEIGKRFQTGNMVRIRVYNSFYGIGSRLECTVKNFDNDGVLALRNAFFTANGQAEHIERMVIK